MTLLRNVKITDTVCCASQVKSLCFDHSGTYLAVAGTDIK